MSKQFSIAAILLLFAIHGLASNDNNNELWKKGNAFYEQKQYDSAAYYYEQIAALRPLNAEVYYNLGNTYYRLNRIPMAVLYYERAIRLDPKNVEAKDNLAVTQSRISNHIPQAKEIFFINWWQSITEQGKATGWALAALFTFILIIAGLWVRRFVKNGQLLPIQVPGVLGFVCACFIVLAFVAAENSRNASGAVVMENNAPLMNSEQKGKPLALIPEGTTVKLSGEKGMWVEVTLPDGRSGWLLQNQVTKI